MTFSQSALALTSLAATALFLKAALPGPPETLIGTHFRYVETNGPSIVSFLPNNEFTISRTNILAERGFYTPNRTGDSWFVGMTRWNGTITWRYVFNFQTATSGIVNITVAGQGTRTAPFQQSLTGLEPPPPPPPNHAPATLATVFVTNSFSAAGPSFYRIDFSGGTNGTFLIHRPGYGTGSFVYTSGVNTGRLVMTYSADLTGDLDDLALQFNAPGGPTTLNSYTGVQSINGRQHPITGVFTHTTPSPPIPPL